ncbi:hypothetical protein OXX79_001492 [Metschnikowia pulcherrima]
MPVHPVVLWAQRSSESEPAKNVIYLTIQVQDPVDVKLDLTAQKLTFSAQSADKATLPYVIERSSAQNYWHLVMKPIKYVASPSDHVHASSSPQSMAGINARGQFGQLTSEKRHSSQCGGKDTNGNKIHYQT